MLRNPEIARLRCLALAKACAWPLRASLTVPEEQSGPPWRAYSLSYVVRFIHLKGPPGIGKSTIAKMYADRHPGVLNLEIDQVVALTGDWQDMFSEAFEAGRLLAARMARTHLTGDHDVVMPLPCRADGRR